MFFYLSRGLFGSVMLHSDDGIQHVEAILEEPTNHLDANPNSTLTLDKILSLR